MSVSAPPRRRLGIRMRVGSLEIDVHASLLVIMALTAIIMATTLLPSQGGDRPAGDLWIIGAGCAFLLALSLALHEVAHLCAERLRGREANRLTLVFLHGGHPPLPEPGTGPWGEMLVAMSGPFATLALGFGALGLEPLAEGRRFAAPLVEFLAVTNLLLGAAQLVPGYPLDGGRALRAVAWGISGDANTGTRWASRVSLVFSVVLFAACAAMLPFTGVFSLPLWGCLMAVVIGLQSLAIARLARTREKLSGLAVAQVMSPLPEALPRIVSVADAIASAAARGVSAFLVEFHGRLGGIVTLSALEQVPEEERWQTPVGQVTRKLERQHLIDPAMAVERAVKRMAEEGLPLLPVLSSGRLVGVVSMDAVTRLLDGRGR